MSDNQFFEDFRMSKSTFQLLHQKLKDSDAFKCTNGDKPTTSSEKSLFIGIWVLATPDSYRSIARRFNVSKSTVVLCVRRVVRGLLTDVCKNAIKLPSKELERVNTSIEFEEIAGMRKVLGAIDGCHIKIRAPKKDKTAYFNRKKDYAILLQGMCDANLYFTNVDVRWPGSVHDARAFHTSDLYPIGSNMCKNNYFIIGDSAYPLKNWLMRPYKRMHRLNRKQKLYNEVLSKTRQVIERAFGHLKNKFRRLYYLHMMTIKDSVEAIVACCILHNICLVDEDRARILIFGENEIEENEYGIVADQQSAKEKRISIVNEIWQMYCNREISECGMLAAVLRTRQI